MGEGGRFSDMSGADEDRAEQCEKQCGTGWVTLVAFPALSFTGCGNSSKSLQVADPDSVLETAKVWAE
jgi:hypothetical protein